MAKLHLNFYSTILSNSHKSNIFIPDRGDVINMPILWLLHGYGGDETDWLSNTNIEELANKYNYILVMPEGYHSFYVDSDIWNYYAFFLKEYMPKIQKMFHLSTNPKQNFIGGVSMGGYGSLNFYLNNITKFNACFALSPVMDLAALLQNSHNPIRVPELLSIMGPAEQISKHSIILNKQNIPEKAQLFIKVGTDDFLYHDILGAVQTKQPNLQFEIGTGHHLWTTWKKELPEVFDWIEKQR